jgi:hypothetical protein
MACCPVGQPILSLRAVFQMRVLISLLAGAVVVFGISSGQAGLEPGIAGVPPVEVLVFEHPDSVSCHLFRRDVLPKYDRMMRAEAPLRFVDVSGDGAAGLSLNARIDVVPTAVVVRDGREIDRIVGYWGPSNFFRLLSHILARLEEQPG